MIQSSPLAPAAYSPVANNPVQQMMQFFGVKAQSAPRPEAMALVAMDYAVPSDSAVEETIDSDTSSLMSMLTDLGHQGTGGAQEEAEMFLGLIGALKAELQAQLNYGDMAAAHQSMEELQHLAWQLESLIWQGAEIEGHGNIPGMDGDAPFPGLPFTPAEGQPYQWGGAGNPGYDCSSFAQRLYADNGFHLPRTVQQQYELCRQNARLLTGSGLGLLEDAQEGDLLFFSNPYSKTASPGHVMVYAGNGRMAGAQATGIAQYDIAPMACHLLALGRPY